MNFYVLMFVVVFATLGDALKCNLCIGAPGGCCSSGDTSEVTDQECGNPQQINSLIHFGNFTHHQEELDVKCIYVEAKVNGMVLAERGCGYIYQGEDLCEYLEPLVEELNACEVCTTDNCN